LSPDLVHDSMEGYGQLKAKSWLNQVSEDTNC